MANSSKVLANEGMAEFVHWVMPLGFMFLVPDNFSCDPELHFLYKMNGGNLGQIVLAVQIRVFHDGDVFEFDDDECGGPDWNVTEPITVPDVEGQLDAVVIPLLKNDGMKAGNCARIFVCRKGGPNDTADGVIEPIQITLQYQRN